MEKEVPDPSPRSRRQVKPRFSSQEWVTDEPPSKVPKRSSSVKKKLVEDDIEDHVTFADDSEDTTMNTTAQEQEDLTNDENINEDVNGEPTAKGKMRIPSHTAIAKWREGVKCPHCSYVGHSATRLEQHFARVHEEDQIYKCKSCSFRCKWNREFYKHMKEHFEGPPYKCEDCDYVCDRIQFIISHRMRHTNERPYGCELCDFRSRTKGNLMVHMRMHSGEKPYRCQHCGRCFAMKNTLDQHLATHRDDRPFLCDICGFTTKYQSHLLSHKRIHTGNVFHCEQPGCSYYSPRRSQLAAHMRSHLSIRSHICSTCGRGFIEKSHLIRHERIHLEEKPFKCEYHGCDYGSTRRDKLKEHILKHHNAEGAPKTPYKPRKPRSARSTAQMNHMGEEVGEPQIIIGSGSPQDVQDTETSQMSEQELATANLIYEYAGSGDTVGPTRVVIQRVGGEYAEGQTVVVEGDGDNGEQHEVIIYEACDDGQNGASTKMVKSDVSGLNAFMALIQDEN
ncbi:Histone-lysine N-methyltransferase PRDM9 [Halotydeus destructor]|nr:Histone-lysine N-methyltransferase PRDM9 [Halotydeus destructor]